MQGRISAVPFDEDLDRGPHIMVVPAGRDEPTESLYRRHAGAPPSCLARKPVAIILRSDVLNTPDRMAITGARQKGMTLELDVEVRRYDGPLAANDPWIALMRIDIASFDPGEHRIAVFETELRFADLHHPETAADATTGERRLDFACV